jgi:tight adherence protein B
MLSVARFVALGVATAFALRAARRTAAGDRVRSLRPAPRSRAAVLLDAHIGPVLRSAGIDVDVRSAAILWLASSLALIAVTSAVAPAFVYGALVAAVASVPLAILLGRRRQKRAVLAAAPALLEVTAHHLRSGGTITGALDEIGETDRSPLAGDCRRVLARTRLGLRLPDALALWMVERPVPEVRAVAGALGIAAELGGRSAAALDGLARGLRDRTAVAAESAALATQATLSAVVIGVAPIGYLVLTTAIGGHELHVLTATAAGRVCLAIGIGLEGLAVIWMHRIVTRLR